MKKTSFYFSVLLSFLGLSSASLAQESFSWNPCPQLTSPDNPGVGASGKPWDFTASAYTHHWSNSPEHKTVLLVAADRQLADNRFCGMAVFTNSFGQPTAYPYFGKRWDGVLGSPNTFVKVTAGLLYGYKDQYKDKIPLNKYGIAPAIIPALGYRFTKDDSGQIMVLGTAGVLFAYGRSF